MKIKLSLAVAQQLLAYAAATRMEYSGFGFCDREPNGDIFVYDFVLLNVGSEAYTEIDPKRILPLLEREDRGKMKVWVHIHPMGSGIPGPENWSGRDNLTIAKEPLGSTPEACNWSVSIVITPRGWVGRIDNYVKGITKHLEVEPAVFDLFQAVKAFEAVRHGQPFLPHADSEGEPDAPGWDEYLVPWEPEADDCGIQAALEELAREYDPTLITLAEICEDYGIVWEQIYEKGRN